MQLRSGNSLDPIALQVCRAPRSERRPRGLAQRAAQQGELKQRRLTQRAGLTSLALAPRSQKTLEQVHAWFDPGHEHGVHTSEPGLVVRMPRTRTGTGTVPGIQIHKNGNALFGPHDFPPSQILVMHNWMSLKVLQYAPPARPSARPRAAYPTRARRGLAAWPNRAPDPARLLPARLLCVVRHSAEHFKHDLPVWRVCAHAHDPRPAQLCIEIPYPHSFFFVF